MEQNQPTGPAPNPQPVTRREFLAGGAVVAAGALALRGGNLSRLAGGPLSSFTRRSAGKTGNITFWVMEWDASAYSTEGAALAAEYNKLYPKNLPVSYQAV